MRQNSGKSFFIIKPEGLTWSREIKHMITEGGGLVINETKIVVLTSDDVDILYHDDQNTELIKTIKKYLVGKKVEAGIVVGEQAAERLSDICGNNFRPSDNTVETIRGKFGKKEPIILDGKEYYLNVIHKASDNEIISSLEWFEKIKMGR